LWDRRKYAVKDFFEMGKRLFLSNKSAYNSWVSTKIIEKLKTKIIEN